MDQCLPTASHHPDAIHRPVRLPRTALLGRSVGLAAFFAAVLPARLDHGAVCE